MIEILARRRAFLCMTSELEELYQEVILDHSRRPRNFGELRRRGCARARRQSVLRR